MAPEREQSGSGGDARRRVRRGGGGRGAARVRDSQHTADPRLQLTPEAWSDFVSYASEG
ncbi:DUF397 domain-containing protein [Streptomyces spinosirectus]|uniref:DUF397 domain-containing protein n=1 Tax=Streptomyces TaxID=1883 RepID=UPI000D35215F|nr:MULTISPECIES: DUF397 domain-containing protein [Streptomyces]MBY8341373.1 DUF397 domain-containing protein [Streptomyces plumbidurans]UIR23043.1 DUF397 domain-containing protein [Streptomyces spinosirectus]